MNKLYKYKEAAQYLGLKENTVRIWVSQGKIPHYKVGNLVRFSQEQLDSVIIEVPTKEGQNED